MITAAPAPWPTCWNVSPARSCRPLDAGNLRCACWPRAAIPWGHAGRCAISLAHPPACIGTFRLARTITGSAPTQAPVRCEIYPHFSQFAGTGWLTRACAWLRGQFLKHLKTSLLLSPSREYRADAFRASYLTGADFQRFVQDDDAARAALLGAPHAEKPAPG